MRERVLLPLPPVLALLSCSGVVVPPDPECLARAPEHVHLRDAQQSFNERYLGWVCKGGVYVKPNTDATGEVGEWQKLWLPWGLQDRVDSITMDDRFIQVADTDRELWMNGYALEPLEAFDWAQRKGMPFSLGASNFLPEEARGWTLSAASAEVDVHYTDAAGWLREVGWATCTHVFLLKENGRWIGFNDGWLPADWNYEMCGPWRGRFVAERISSSGARHMVINRYGDIFTRIFDYDVSGANNPFEDYFDYTYEDQRGIDRDGERRFQLPPWPWFQQPKIPGRITDRISLHKVGRDGLHALMRVEGWDDDGNSGYYEKDMHDVVEDPWDQSGWRFVRTDLPARGSELDNRPEDSVALTLGPSEDVCFAWNIEARDRLPGALAGEIRDQDWAAELISFHPYCSPAVLRVHVTPSRYYDLVLHSTETLRLDMVTEPPGRGLLSTPRPRRGSIEVPLNVYRRYRQGSLHPVMARFIDHYLGGERFHWVDVQASRRRVSLQNVEWLFWGVDWRLDRLPCAATSKRENDGNINDPELDGGASYGLRFEDLFLDRRAAQIYTDPDTAEDLPSQRNVHSFDELRLQGW